MIVIPMAGRSKRFRDAGYSIPKFMLRAHGQSLFYYSLLSFKNYFSNEIFLFIVLEQDSARSFIISECEKLGIRHSIVELKAPTVGQADTVAKGLSVMNPDPEESILIFNIDTFRWNYRYPRCVIEKKCSGYLEVFIGDGKNWSNVIPHAFSKNKVARTSEKKNESEFCSTGLYYFETVKFFEIAFNLTLEKCGLALGEVYVAPIYNELIELGHDVRYEVVERDDVVFCGVPSEYEEFLATPLQSLG